MTYEEAAKVLKVSVRTISRYVEYGKLKKSGRFVTRKSVIALGDGEVDDIEEIEKEEAEVEKKLKEGRRLRGRGFVKGW